MRRGSLKARFSTHALLSTTALVPVALAMVLAGVNPAAA
jgi:hypothetical protein